MSAEVHAAPLRRTYDLAVTLAAWGYFLCAFLAGFGLLYAAAGLCPKPQLAFQRLNHWYYRGFFALLRLVAPRQRWRLAPELAACRSCVVLCNHLSYLDPLLLMAHLPRCTTVAQARLFDYPIFGWVLKSAGYVPASSEGQFAGLMLDQLEGLRQYLAEGGVLFLFPEGTRSKSGAVGALLPGALKLARQSGAPLVVFRFDNTGRLFPPGRFLFDAASPREIRLSFQGRIAPEEPVYSGPLAELSAHLQALLVRPAKPSA